MFLITTWNNGNENGEWTQSYTHNTLNTWKKSIGWIITFLI
jgi:hypothetical protein